MPQKEFAKEMGAISSPDRLTRAVRDGWCEYGSSDLSVRSIAQAAGLPASSIYHHFGSLEQMYEIAQAQAQKEAERWCAARIDAVEGSALSPAAFPIWLAALIDDWTCNQPDLAFAWVECRRMAAHDARYLPALEAWRALWSAFWNEACDRCEISEFGRMTALLFDGESVLHLMQWRRTVDRACLEEFCQGWGNWQGGRLAPEGPWRRFARAEAVRSMPALPVRGGAAERIASAAAEIIEKHGVGRLTHRAVAAEAGVTLGLVSYNFRTSADLARAAFETIHDRTIGASTDDISGELESAEAATDRLIGYHQQSVFSMAGEELLIAAGRSAALESFRPQLRYLRGRTSRGVLQALLGPEHPISPLDAALFSSFATGQRRNCVGKTPDEIEAFVRKDLMDLRALLAR